MDYSIAWSVWERHQSGLSIIQSQEVLQSTAPSLAAHALKAEVRGWNPREAVTESSWERGVNSQLISENAQEKMSQPRFIACGIHREILLNLD